MNSRLAVAAMSLVCALSLAGIAPSAQAAALTTTQINAIVALLQSFGADASTVSNVQAALTGSPAAAVSTPTAGTSVTEPGQPAHPEMCGGLAENMRVGSTDSTTNGEVSRIQTFLSQDKNIYPEGLVTGYYGPATEAAVQKWQEQRGIVSSGDPESTGFGAVGPRTRAEMGTEIERSCGTTSTTGTTSTETHTTDSTTSTNNQ